MKPNGFLFFFSSSMSRWANDYYYAHMGLVIVGTVSLYKIQMAAQYDVFRHNLLTLINVYLRALVVDFWLTLNTHLILTTQSL